MTSVERRRLLCAILFHFVAAICVVWSLFVLIDRAAEEVQKGLIGRYLMTLSSNTVPLAFFFAFSLLPLRLSCIKDMFDL